MSCLAGEVRAASRGQEIVSVASRVVNPKHDELRPAVSKELYQLRPKVSASCVFAVSRVVNRTHELHRKIWVYKMSNNLKVLHSFIVRYFLHNYMHKLNDSNNAQLLYHITV